MKCTYFQEEVGQQGQKGGILQSQCHEEGILGCLATEVGICWRCGRKDSGIEFVLIRTLVVCSMQSSHSSYLCIKVVWIKISDDEKQIWPEDLCGTTQYTNQVSVRTPC